MSRYEVVAGTAMWIELLTTPLLVFLVGFLVGYLSGVGVRHATQKQVRHAIALTITFAWSLSLIAAVFEPAYHTPLAVHGIMGAVAGYLFQFEDGSLHIPDIK